MIKMFNLLTAGTQRVETKKISDPPGSRSLRESRKDSVEEKMGNLHPDPPWTKKRGQPSFWVGWIVVWEKHVSTKRRLRSKRGFNKWLERIVWTATDSSPQCHCSAIVVTTWEIVFSCFSFRLIFVCLLHTGLFVWLFDQTWWQWEYQDIHLKVIWHIDNFLFSSHGSFRLSFSILGQRRSILTSSTWSWSPPRPPRSSTRTPPTCSPPSPLLPQSPSSPDPFALHAPFKTLPVSCSLRLAWALDSFSMIKCQVWDQHRP